MNTNTEIEQILKEGGVSIEELINTGYESLVTLYWNYPRIRREFALEDLINDTLLYFFQNRKDGQMRLKYYLADGKQHLINTFRNACKQNLLALCRYNFIKYQAVSLNTPIDEGDSDHTELMDMISAPTDDTNNLYESLEQIYEMLDKANKERYYQKVISSKHIRPLEVLLDVNTYINLYKQAELQKQIISFLNEGYSMREIKKVLNIQDFDENINTIKEVFTNYYQLKMDKVHSR